MTDERYAPEGKMWVCHACGKFSKDRYGDGESSWDESCMLNSVLHDTNTLQYSNDGRSVVSIGTPVVHIEGGPNA